MLAVVPKPVDLWQPTTIGMVVEPDALLPSLGLLKRNSKIVICMCHATYFIDTLDTNWIRPSKWPRKKAPKSGPSFVRKSLQFLKNERDGTRTRNHRIDSPVL